MVEFAGWEMPLVYTGISEEHHHTRTACSIFDVSHMGRIWLEGASTEEFLQRICTRNLDNMEPGQSRYSHICREDGGILDDVIVSRNDDGWGIVCNASNRDKIIAWMKDHHQPGVEMKDQTSMSAMLAAQGPKTLEIADWLSTDVKLSELKRYRFITKNVMGFSVQIYRSGYTGEDGLELVFPAGIASMVANKLLEVEYDWNRDIKPAGLGARDTLRIEAAMPLYGHELTEEWDPITAGQGWCVDLEKDFIGVEPMRKLNKQALPRQMVGMELGGKRTARQGYPIHAGGKAAGIVTSGTLSPTLGKSIAMGFVQSEFAADGTDIEVEFGGGKRMPARVVPLPFYKRAK